MVTRREKMKHTLCDLQEKIFDLKIQLLEEDMAGGKRESEGDTKARKGLQQFKYTSVKTCYLSPTIALQPKPPTHTQSNPPLKKKKRTIWKAQVYNS